MNQPTNQQYLLASVITMAHILSTTYKVVQKTGATLHFFKYLENYKR